MLNKSERHQVLKKWKQFAFLGQLPVQVDLTNWRLSVPKLKKLWICTLSYILHGLHSLFILGSLVYTCLFVPDFKVYQVMIHAVMAFCSLICTFWHYIVYAKDPGLFNKYAELTLVGNVGGTPELKDRLKKRWRRRLREYSLQDVMATSSPYAMMTTLVLISALYVYDPSMSILLFNYLPSYLQNWATFALLLVEEVRLCMMNASIATPIWQLHVTSFDLVSNRLLALREKIENGRVTRMTTYKILRSLQLYVSMFNQVNRYLIFTWKLPSITGAILAGFAAVAHFQEQPAFGIVYYIMLLDFVFIYALIYEKAFKVPQLFDEAASRALLYMCANRRDVFKKQISSIQPAAITVGRFHRMERASTLIFINFVVTNIVSMLVAFA